MALGYKTPPLVRSDSRQLKPGGASVV